MDFALFEGYTVVQSTLHIGTNPNYTNNDNDEGLVLNGDETNVKLLSLSKDDIALPSSDYMLSPGKLIVGNVTDGSVIKITVEIVPEDNTQLSGLYKSGGMFCSQCEAEGFRRSELFTYCLLCSNEIDLLFSSDGMLLQLCNYSYLLSR